MRKVATFYRHLRHVLREDRVDICFSHMIALFSVLGAPLLRPRGVPIVTWHAHPSVNWRLRAAGHLSELMVTSLPGAYPYQRGKVAVIGQGIDTALFAPDGTAAEEKDLVLCVGRVSPVKDHPTLLKAVDLLRRRRRRLRVAVVGGPSKPSDHAYIASLHEMVTTLGLEGIVRFEPPVPLDELPRWYRRCAVHVNMTRAGSGDKVVLEAMSAGRPCVVANPGFGETLGPYAGMLLARNHDAHDLAAKLETILDVSPDAREEIGTYLRQQVIRLHSLERLADRLVELFQQIHERRGANVEAARV
jgi:glycosyltransferase involved in cell wall biosynthesis